MHRATSPTINDVAAAAGVSVATASRALAGYGRVAAATVARVSRVAMELGYRPNELARAMRIGSTRTIGLVIVADFTNAFFDRATKAIIDAARTHDYQVLISNTDEDLEVERKAVQTLVDKQVDGLIIVPSLGRNHDHIRPTNLGGRPIVLIDRRVADLGVATITTDDRSSASEAVLRAVAMGHRRLGFLISAVGVEEFTAVRPMQMISTVDDRTEGFAEGAQSAGIAPSDQVWAFCEDEPAVSLRAVDSMLDGPEPPTVIFTSNNDMALAVLKSVAARGLTIGKDVSLVTVDDSQWAAAITPAITVIARPVEELGRTAVSSLVRQIATGQHSSEEVVLPTELIVRGSLAQPAGAPDARIAG